MSLHLFQSRVIKSLTHPGTDAPKQFKELTLALPTTDTQRPTIWQVRCDSVLGGASWSAAGRWQALKEQGAQSREEPRMGKSLKGWEQGGEAGGLKGIQTCHTDGGWEGTRAPCTHWGGRGRGGRRRGVWGSQRSMTVARRLKDGAVVVWATLLLRFRVYGEGDIHRNTGSNTCQDCV